MWIDFVDGIGRSRLAAKLPALVKPLVVTGRNFNTVVKLEALLGRGTDRASQVAPLIAHTEYSLGYHHEYVAALTGLPGRMR